MRLIALFLSLFLFSCSNTTKTESFSSLFSFDSVYYMSGSLDSAQYMQFNDFANKVIQKNNKVIKVYLNSPGGEIYFTNNIVNKITEIKAHGVKVIFIVESDKECSSSCTALFAYGDERIVSNKSRWLFHSPYVFRPNYNIDADPSTSPSEKKWLHNTVNEARAYFYQSILLVDKQFADFLNDNYFTKDGGANIKYSGSELNNSTKSYVTKVVD